MAIMMEMAVVMSMIQIMIVVTRMMRNSVMRMMTIMTSCPGCSTRIRTGIRMVI